MKEKIVGFCAMALMSLCFFNNALLACPPGDPGPDTGQESDSAQVVPVPVPDQETDIKSGTEAVPAPSPETPAPSTAPDDQ